MQRQGTDNFVQFFYGKPISFLKILWKSYLIFLGAMQIFIDKWYVFLKVVLFGDLSLLLCHSLENMQFVCLEQTAIL